MKTLLAKSIKKASSFIKRSELVAFPTETVYGLGANAFDEKALKKIFKIKHRPLNNPLIVHISDKKQIVLLAEKIPIIAKKLITRLFPGPITLILKKNGIVPQLATSGLNTVAIRMPSLMIAQKFIKECGVPIAAPSANLSGSPSPTTYRHVFEDFKGKIPCILVGPEAKYGLESTVVDCTSKIPAVLRPGVVTLEQLRKIDRRIKLKRAGKLKSPGQRYTHYAPKAHVVLIPKADTKHPLKLLRRLKSGRTVPVLPLPFFPFTPDISVSPLPSLLMIPSPARPKKASIGYIGLQKLNHEIRKRCRLYMKCRNVEDYAKKLFSFFRECDRKGIENIYAQKVSENGIGLALMNRLKKAAHK